MALIFFTCSSIRGEFIQFFISTGDLEYTLTLTWEDGVATGIDGMADSLKQERLYTIDGRRATEKSKGLIIRKTSDGDGRKTFVR